MNFHEQATRTKRAPSRRAPRTAAATAVHVPVMDLQYMMYMLQFQGTPAVKEEVCKDFLILNFVEVMTFHEKVAVAVAVKTVHVPLMDLM